jgi:hypothetical protein
VADDDFDSIDAIEKHFGKQIKAAGDDEEKVRELRIDQREAKADFRDRSSAKRELDTHRAAALAKAGIPEDFHDFVTGGTTEEIDASVAKVKERLDKLTAGRTSDDDAARRLYGAPATGGGTPPGPRSSDDEKWIDDFQKRFDDPSATFTVQEVTKYAEKLGGAHLFHNLAETSRIFRRNGITPELVADHEAGKLRQTRPAKTGVTIAPRG